MHGGSTRRSGANRSQKGNETGRSNRMSHLGDRMSLSKGGGRDMNTSKATGKHSHEDDSSARFQKRMQRGF